MRFGSIIFLLLAIGTVGFPAQAQVLFDGSLGTAPDAQGWSLFAPPPLASGVLQGTFALDSRPAGNAGRGGITRESPVALERGAGYSLGLSLRVDAEAHASIHRSGISLILLGADRRGIELAFWTDRLWTQADSPLFTHAEEGRIDTTRGFIEYAVTVSGDGYTVTAEGRLLLSGPLRDYTAFSGFPDVYEIPNLIFLGDNTTSAAGAFSLRRIELVPPSPPLLRAGMRGRNAVGLSWPSMAADWVLEDSASPDDATAWQPVLDPPVTADGILTVEIPVFASARYFRLRR